MPSQNVTSVEDLDLGVAERQAFGTVYGKPAKHETLTKLVKAGTLRLPPHPNWTGDVTDWKADPYKDRNWQFQHHTLRWLNPLRWSALEGDEAAAEEWRRVAKSWGEKNIPAKKAPGLFAWKDMADGNRAIQLSLGAPLIRPEDDWYIPLLQYHVDWLMDEANIVKKNHALHQHSGLVVVAALLRDRRALNTAYDRMAKQFKSTFDAQGANDEGAVGYHEMNLKWWTQAWARIEAEGLKIPSFAAARLEAGRTALAQMVLPNGMLPQIGDTKRVAVSRGLGPHVEYVATQGKDGEAPTETAVAYERGYVVSRSGWGQERPLAAESHMILRFGHDVLSHSHQDRGGVHIYSRGRPWLSDSGYYSYQTGDATRNHFLSQDAHNIARLPEQVHSLRAEVELERFTATEAVHDAVVRDHGYQDVEMRRRVLYLTGPDCWIVWDEASDPTPIEQNWIVDIGVLSRRHDRGFELRSDDQTMNMTWLGTVPALSRHVAKEGDPHAWIATKWKTLEAATLLTAVSSRNRKRSVVLIAPSAPQELAVIRSYVSTSGQLSAMLMRGPRVWSVQIEGEDVTITEVERSWD